MAQRTEESKMLRNPQWESGLYVSSRFTEGCGLRTKDSKESGHQVILTNLYITQSDRGKQSFPGVGNTLSHRDQNARKMGLVF